MMGWMKHVNLTLFILLFFRSRRSSVSIVSDYGLDDRVIRVRSPAGAKDFYNTLCVKTVSEAHPASCTMGTGGPFPGAKRGRGMTLTTHPHLVSRSRMSRSYTSSPPQAPPWRVAGLLYFALFIYLFVVYLMTLLRPDSVERKSNMWMMTWKGYGRKPSRPNWYYPGTRLERLRKTTKHHSHDSRSPRRDLNQGPSEYEAVNHDFRCHTL
jgi:hypothetical protein